MSFQCCQLPIYLLLLSCRDFFECGFVEVCDSSFCKIVDRSLAGYFLLAPSSFFFFLCWILTVESHIRDISILPLCPISVFYLSLLKEGRRLRKRDWHEYPTMEAYTTPRCRRDTAPGNRHHGGQLSSWLRNKSCIFIFREYGVMSEIWRFICSWKNGYIFSSWYGLGERRIWKNPITKTEEW